MRYKHTQPGTFLRWVLGIGLIITVGVALGIDGVSEDDLKWFWLGFLPVPIILCLCVWIFGSLTVQIDDRELSHWFGPGFWKKSYELIEIESAEQVRNTWLYGWGIRLTPHGWLYNVSGLDAVQIQLCSGRKFRIGTDNPQGLLEALQQSS